VGVSAAAQVWTPVSSGTTVGLRGVSAASTGIVWVSGEKGIVLKTTDGGRTWRSTGPSGAGDVDFRDIESFAGNPAVYLLGSGEGPKSRIYKTTDAGASWSLLTTNLEPKGFWDCMSFWDPTHGIIVGDPVDGRFTILTTIDGATWQSIKGPPANKDEGAFAASGTCVVTRGTREVWFATGGLGGARVFHSQDGGQSWSVAKTPLRHDSPTAGIFSLEFSDALHGIAIGGDYMKPEEAQGNIAVTQDGGKTWIAPAGPGPKGYRSAVSEGTATGISGTDASTDRGQTWTKSADDGYNAISGKWMVGPNGRIATSILPVPH
jgi:photosystem II stability/assembly factor-like uncharacterized protein